MKRNKKLLGVHLWLLIWSCTSSVVLKGYIHQSNHTAACLKTKAVWLYFAICEQEQNYVFAESCNISLHIFCHAHAWRVRSSWSPSARWRRSPCPVGMGAVIIPPPTSMSVGGGVGVGGGSTLINLPHQQSFGKWLWTAFPPQSLPRLVAVYASENKETVCWEILRNQLNKNNGFIPTPKRTLRFWFKKPTLW